MDFQSSLKNLAKKKLEELWVESISASNWSLLEELLAVQVG